MERAAPAGVVRPCTSCWPLLGPREKRPKLEWSYHVIRDSNPTRCLLSPPFLRARGWATKPRAALCCADHHCRPGPPSHRGWWGRPLQGALPSPQCSPAYPWAPAPRGLYATFLLTRPLCRSSSASGPLGPVSVNTVAEPEWTRASSRDQEGPSSCRGGGRFPRLDPRPALGSGRSYRGWVLKGSELDRPGLWRGGLPICHGTRDSPKDLPCVV